MKKLLTILFLFLSVDLFAQKGSTYTKTAWLKTFDFNPSSFQTPPLQFAPVCTLVVAW